MLLFMYVLCFAPKVVSLREICICSPNFQMEGAGEMKAPRIGGGPLA